MNSYRVWFNWNCFRKFANSYWIHFHNPLHISLIIDFAYSYAGFYKSLNHSIIAFPLWIAGLRVPALYFSFCFRVLMPSLTASEAHYRLYDPKLPFYLYSSVGLDSSLSWWIYFQVHLMMIATFIFLNW